MKTLTILCLMLLSSTFAIGQQLQRSSLGNNGATHSIEVQGTQYFISESIGQYGIAGTSGTVRIVRQGYQQPPLSIKRVRGFTESDSLEVTVYPNPVESTVFIRFEKKLEESVSIRLYSMLGQELLSQEVSNIQLHEMDLSNLAVGTYFLKATNGVSSYQAKLIKN